MEEVIKMNWKHWYKIVSSLCMVIVVWITIGIAIKEGIIDTTTLTLLGSLFTIGVSCSTIWDINTHN